MPTPEPLYLDRIQTPTGPMLVVFDADERLRALDWQDHEARMRTLLVRHYGAEGTGYSLAERALPASLAAPLQAYFAGDLAAIAGVRTRTAGTAFQRAVWAALRDIPAASTLSYGALAQRIGRPKAVRAVGLANGANPIAIAVPCHRVIGGDGSLTGYGGGLERKRWLLAHEADCAARA